MYHIQDLIQPIIAHESSGICQEMHPVVPPIVNSTPNRKTSSLCQSCQLVHSKFQAPKVNQPNNQDLTRLRESLSQDAYEAGEIVSIGQYVVNPPGNLLLGFVGETPHNQLNGGTLFHNASTGLIWAENHVSLGAGKTLMAKECFGQWL